MKKIIISVAVLCGLSAFASEISGPRYRLEGNIGGAMQIQKQDAGLKAWQRYTNLSASFMPEWKYEVNNKLDLVFGPKATFAVRTSIAPNSDKIVKDNWYGFAGALGGELDLDFKLPEGEIIYLGFDSEFKGIGYTEKLTTKLRGFGFGTGLTVGGKLSGKIKLGLRLGYEYEKLWNVKENNESRSEDTQQNSTPTTSNVNSLAVGVTFGYLLGE